jgi:membrane protein DedA with SNARE-associated domain
MTEKILELIFAFVTSTISSGGYAGVSLLMAIESACIPLPSEIIMPFAGYLVFKGQFSLWVVAIAGAIGCNLGSIPAYWVGAKGGRPLIERYGKYVLLSHHDLDLSTNFFNKYGSITVFLARLLPVVRTFIALPAGIAKMPLWRFHIYTFAGSLPWCFLLAYAGQRLGEAWHTDPRFHALFHRFHMVVVLLLLAGIAYFLWSHLARFRKHQNAA